MKRFWKFQICLIMFFFLVTLVGSVGSVNAGNIEAELQSSDGSDAFQVKDSAGTPLMHIQSDGKVGIGTANPETKIDIRGSIKISDGTEGSNKVLTSDAAGMASWQTMAAPGVPAGTILMFAASNLPSGWLLCDGSAVSRTTYATLFGVIGTTFGAGDGSTTFNIPNLKGKVPIGFDSSQTEFNSLGNTGGEKTHTLTISEMPAHTHSVYAGIRGNPYDPYRDSIISQAGTLAHYDPRTTESGMILNAGSGIPHNNLQPYIVLQYIIKN